MPVEGIEWVVVLGVVLVMLLWSPEKIPEFARAVGRFVNELQRTRAEADRYVSDFLQPIMGAADSADRQLIEVARRLNIVTEGLKKDEIVALINKKLEGAASG
ncbi:MAG: twin-arginine translocase TatA/TatE family subunit [Nitrososphaerota archaeon]|nr:twin-arginine translocase TatA/TatE family subunit [Candidatus Calditenuaceae archaeon]MDW8073806.1 twin-arginine translocase TatA/TatE family subunit [Nitrososphaerota archaeon]